MGLKVGMLSILQSAGQLGKGTGHFIFDIWPTFLPHTFNLVK